MCHWDEPSSSGHRVTELRRGYRDVLPWRCVRFPPGGLTARVNTFNCNAGVRLRYAMFFTHSLRARRKVIVLMLNSKVIIIRSQPKHNFNKMFGFKTCQKLAGTFITHL